VNMTVKARHMDVTDAIRDYVESKLAKLPRYYDNIQTIEAILDVEAEHAVVEVVVTARRKSTFVATHREQDLYAAVDQCVQKISEQLRRHKDKVRDRQGPSLSESTEATQS
jgi:putative sigma-54 modulation protein